MTYQTDKPVILWLDATDVHRLNNGAPLITITKSQIDQFRDPYGWPMSCLIMAMISGVTTGLAIATWLVSTL